MNSDYEQVTNRDPLCDFFSCGAKYFSITNHHIYLLQGKLNPEIMEISLSSIIEEFEVFVKRFKFPSNKISHVEFEDTDLFISFSSKEFREHLLQKCSNDELHGSLEFPIRLYFSYSRKQNLTCMHLAITHDVADIKSGNIFVSRLMNAYGCNLSGNTLSFRSSFEAYKHPYMKDIMPGCFHPLAVFKRGIMSNICIIYRIFSVDRTVVAPAGIKNKNYILSKRNKNFDFVHHVLSNQLQAGIQEAAKFYNVTINTIFSGALVLYISDRQYSRKSSANFTIAVSLRKNGLIDATNSFRTFMVDCKVRIQKYSDYSRLLSAINKKISHIRGKRLYIEIGRMESAILLFNKLVPSFLRSWIMRRTQGTNVFFSNPGVIEEDFRYFGDEKTPIVDCAIFGGLVPPYDLMLVTSTVNGKMQIDSIFNKNVFGNGDETFTRPFLCHLHEIVKSSIRSSQD